MSNEQREKASDQAAKPLVHYVYILELDNDELYVGQTNNLEARISEHALGVGAEKTKGRASKLIWFTQLHNREAAKYLEGRLRRMIDKSPLDVQSMVAQFNKLVRMISPQKTHADLELEERQYVAEMGRVFHQVSVSLLSPRRAACGWDGGQYGRLYGSADWEDVAKNARVHVAAHAA